MWDIDWRRSTNAQRKSSQLYRWCGWGRWMSNETPAYRADHMPLTATEGVVWGVKVYCPNTGQSLRYDWVKFLKFTFDGDYIQIPATWYNFGLNTKLV